jgi:hypothetical protein
MTAPPAGLASGGRALWRSVTLVHELDPPHLATLELACRQRDRCDMLASDAAAGDHGALRHERDAALAMTRLLAALRLPDEGGRKPQARQIRGVQAPSSPVSVSVSVSVSALALERARLRHAGK